MLPDTNSLADAESQLESARGQLAQRLRAGEPCRAEELFALYPALAGNAELALQLICTEFAVRMELGRQGPLDEWFARFPRWRDELRNRFEVYADHGARADNVPTAAYADPTTEPTRPPPSLQRLGRYDLLAQIGGGGMGVVYKARQPPPLERVVALKLLRGGRLANPEEIRRFSLEAKVAGGLHHPNILPIYELNEHDGQLFLTMPYVEGGSLADRLPHFREPRAAASLVEKIARAVQFLHEHGILHRDLKPSNILLDERGEPLVTDFGLAKLLEGDVQLTETGRVMGTPAYLSPEQAAGRNRQVGVPSDVWALGVILYELLTGRRPFHCEDREELYDLIFAAEPKPPSRLVPGLDRGLENIVLKCLSKEPAERYASAAELADDLRRWLDGLKPVGPTRRRWPARAWKAVRRHPWVSAAVAVLFFVAVCLGAGYALLKPADPLTEGLRKLKNGEQVVWIDETGPPLAYTFGYGGDQAHPEKDRRLPFAVVSQSLALLDLIPDPQQDHYHLSVQVEHSDSFDVISGAGVTLGHQTVAAPEGVHHFLLVLIVNKRLEADDPPGASLTLLHFLDDGRLTAQRTHRLGVGTTFADPPADAKESWHQVDAEVTPEKIKLVLDGKPLPDITWAKVDERAKRLMADPKLPYHIEPPAFGPRGALGLYVYRGQGSFRSLVVQPLPGDK